jgi:DNA-binding Xre family transcriptional regulator
VVERMLAKIIRRKGLALCRLTQESGVSYATLWGLFHKRSKMYRADVLEKLCRAVRCQPRDLL